jgi:hypothetical protein
MEAEKIVKTRLGSVVATVRRESRSTERRREGDHGLSTALPARGVDKDPVGPARHRRSPRRDRGRAYSVRPSLSAPAPRHDAVARTEPGTQSSEATPLVQIHPEHLSLSAPFSRQIEPLLRQVIRFMLSERTMADGPDGWRVSRVTTSWLAQAPRARLRLRRYSVIECLTMTALPRVKKR